MSENTPLLNPSSEISKDIYDRFSNVQKRVILSVVSLAGLISPFASGCFVPCVPEVAKDLNTTGTVINFTVGLYVFMIALGTLIWAPYAGFYGRQPVYLVSLPLLIFGSLGVSLSVNVPQLVFGRAIQAFGASSVMSIGSATISDIYRLEERGTAMGVLFGAVMLGPAIAPLAGGVAATYASWRTMQLILFAMALMAFIAVIMFLPETSHPGSRGIDKLLAQEEHPGPVSPEPGKKNGAWKWVWLNPFAALALLRGPNILFVILSGGCILVTDYVLLIPMSYTIGDRYGITSPALIGACFLFSGLGNIVGAPFAGYLSDRAVIEGRKRRNGAWVPEDRLTATLFSAWLLVPLPVLVFGLMVQFVPGTLGLVINLICLFVNGIGVLVVLSPSATYLVDIVHSRSAEVLAVSIFVRYVMAGIASAGVLPMINEVGVGATNGLAAVIGWFSFVLLWVTIRYGDRLRAWVDIGYTSSVQDS